MGRSSALRVLVWCWGRRGGGPRYSLQVARALARHPELRVFLSTSRRSEIRDANRRSGLPLFEVDTYGGPFSALWATGFHLPALTRRFRAYLEAEGIDLVLCTMCHPWSGWIASRIPCAYLPVVHDARAHPGDPLSGWGWLLRATTRPAEGILFLTDHVRRQFLERIPFPKERTWVVPHGPLIFGDARSPVRHRVQRLLFFGRILPYKGLPLLLKAFAEIADPHDLFLTVAGSGSLGRDAIAYRHHPRIQFENRWIPESEVPGFLGQADLLVAPYVEASQSGVIAAAYGMGVPVVVTPVGGLREQVRSGETGLVAEAVTPQAIRAAIERLCRDPILFQRCQAGARRIGGEASWDPIAQRMVEVFRRICP